MAIIFLLSSLLSIFPIAIWLIFFLWQDLKKPEPLFWLLLAFLGGILITPLVWFLENFYIKLLGFDMAMLDVFQQGLIYLGIALIEEITKFLAVLGILKYNKYFDEAIDAMIYLIVLALGFGLVENILAGRQIIVDGGIMFSIFQIISLRFIGANLLHALSSGLIGFFWALSLIKKKKSFLYLGLFLGIVLHFLFNLVIIEYGTMAIFFVSLSLFVSTLVLLWAFDVLKRFKKPLSLIK